MNEPRIRMPHMLKIEAMVILLSIIFLFAAFSKFGDLGDFQKALSRYNYLPLPIQGVAVLLIPGLELALGVSLMLHSYRKQAILLAMCLLIMFTLLGVYDILFGTTPGTCACFKLSLPKWFELNGWWAITRNILLMGVCFVVYVYNSETKTPVKKEISLESL